MPARTDSMLAEGGHFVVENMRTMERWRGKEGLVHSTILLFRNVFSPPVATRSQNPSVSQILPLQSCDSYFFPDRCRTTHRGRLAAEIGLRQLLLPEKAPRRAHVDAVGVGPQLPERRLVHPSKKRPPWMHFLRSWRTLRLKTNNFV